MRCARVAIVLLLAAGIDAAQDLAPEVLLLARIKVHMRKELSHLPNYTCLQTSVRFRKSDAMQRLQFLDKVKLEIAYSDAKEWFASPGDSSFSADTPFRFVGSGAMGTGPFGMTLRNVLDGGSTAYKGEETLRGRKFVRFDFHLSRFLKGLEISLPGGRGTVGEKGTFWVDPQTLDVDRLQVHADEIPMGLPLESAVSTVNYGRVRIGERNLLLAQQSELQMVETGGEEIYNRIDFTHCRAFSAQSAIRYEGAEESPEIGKGNKPHPQVREAAPALLRVVVQLTTPITDEAAVGTSIDATVSGDVMRKGQVVIADGARVQGRIRRLERFEGGGEFIVGLEFTEVEAVGGPLRFYADLVTLDRRQEFKRTLDRVSVKTTHRMERITLPELPGVALFFVHGERFVLPAGFQTVWRTRGVIRGS